MLRIYSWLRTPKVFVAGSGPYTMPEIKAGSALDWHHASQMPFLYAIASPPSFQIFIFK